MGEGEGGMIERIASKHVYYQVWNRSPVQVGCMRQVLRAGALGWHRGMGCGGRREGGSGWETHVNPWLIHVNVWQKSLQYCKVISFQLIKIIGKEKKKKTVICYGLNIQKRLWFCVLTFKKNFFWAHITSSLWIPRMYLWCHYSKCLIITRWELLRTVFLIVLMNTWVTPHWCCDLLGTVWRMSTGRMERCCWEGRDECRADPPEGSFYSIAPGLRQTHLTSDVDWKEDPGQHQHEK